MKRNLLTLALCAIVLVGFAQQKPHYTQYILNNYILNPALTGIENYTDVKMSARDQWVGHLFAESLWLPRSSLVIG